MREDGLKYSQSGFIFAGSICSEDLEVLSIDVDSCYEIIQWQNAIQTLKSSV
jgi:hypothetical protein